MSIFSLFFHLLSETFILLYSEYRITLNAFFLTTARKVLANTVYQLFGRVAMAGMAVIILKIITGYLGVAGYGDYVTIYEYLGFFAIFADMGIYTIAVREMSKDEKNMSKIIGNIMGLRATLAGALMLLAGGVAFLLPQYQGTLIPMGVLIAGITTFFTMLQGTVCSVLQVHYKMQYATISMIVGKFVSLIYTIVVIYFLFPKTGIYAVHATINGVFFATGAKPALASLPLESGFWHLLVGGVFGGVVMHVIANHFVKKLITYTFEWNFTYWKEVLKTAVPYGLALILNNIYFKIDVLLLSLLLHKDDAGVQTGIYGVAMRMLEMLVIIPVYFMNSVLPILIKYVKEKSDKLQKLIQYSFDFLVATSMPILAGLSILATEIVRFISTDKFTSNIDQGYFGSDIAVQILMFALVFSFINSLFGFMLVSIEKQIKLLWINSACVLFNILGNMVLIPFYGFIGASAVSVFSELFILILVAFTVKKYIAFRINFLPTLKYFLSAVAMGACVLFLKPFFVGHFWLFLVPIGGCVYASCVFLSGAISPEMRKMILKR